MPTASNEFGRFFRRRRTSLGLNLSEFCRLNGFDKGNISRMERGLMNPPESSDLLEHYADSLQLPPDSDDRKAFMRYAALAGGRLPVAVPDERIPEVIEMFQRLDRRLHDSWVKAANLEQWSPSRDAQANLPTLIRKLIYASTEEPTRIEMPGGEGIQRHGWDGIVESQTGSAFVPAGISGWEISVEQRPADKAERDFKARTKGLLGRPASEVTFVFVTSQKWDGKQRWRDEKRELRRWKSVEVYDSSDLEAWLERAPGVDAWVSEHLGHRPPGVVSISGYWDSLSRLCIPRLKPGVFLASREKTAEALRAFLLDTPGVMAVECRSPMEALDFVAAYLATVKSGDTPFAMDENERIRAQSRTIVVRDQAQWDGLSQAAGPLNLLPIPSLALSPEELNIGVRHGHRILVAATQFSNHRLQPVVLPRPSRYDLEKALGESGFEEKDAESAARAAGGSLSVLKRRISTIPDPQVPSWCRGAERADFMPMLLVGAWDDTNEVDRGVLSRLAGRPYRELQNIANRLRLVEDAPLTRIESHWRLVSPEDAWSLVREHVTHDLLKSFEAIAIEVLSQEDELLVLSADERLMASIKGSLKPNASDQLRHGISETAAILGSGFGPNLPETQGAAGRIVRATLQKATWQRWATLDDVLPLLAEAAPDEFLAAVNTDLKKNRPELAKLFADDEEGSLLTSRCKHAGLLWALETLAWSPEQLRNACMILARLDEVDGAHRWGNRPDASLRGILLGWYPQTAAGVEMRIAVLKYLTDRKPAVAWNLLFKMLPEDLSNTDPTRRPVWRDWMSNWKEGASDAEEDEQVHAAAELIVHLVGNDPQRWRKVLDELPRIPESHHKQLIEQLQSFPLDAITSEERRQLAEHLRKAIQRHRDYAAARGAISAESVDALEQALPKLVPEGIRERHAWLFVPWPKLDGFRDRHKEMKEEIDRLRADALREIVDEEGLDGILKFADIVESPWHVGAMLAQIEILPDARILPGLLQSSSVNYQKLAAAYARIRVSCAGWEWVLSLPLGQWHASDAASFLSQARFDSQTWDFAKDLGEDVFREYWKVVPADSLISPRDQEHLEFACQRLLEACRPEDAIDILSAVVLNEVAVSPSVVMDVLAACLEGMNLNPDSRLCDNTLHTIRGLFKWLQKTIPFDSDEPRRRLGQLEWGFLSLLDDFDASPRTLIHYLSENPEFFAQLIAIIFRSKDEQVSTTQSPEDQQKASQGYRLLMNWNRVPGTRSDGSIDEEQLLQWLESARSRCRESGHLGIADSKIGEMLACWPQPKEDDSIWPCEEICDAIEEADSDDLDHGFQIGILNSRGVVSRSPLDGGDLERKEAAKYRRWAERCDTDWPRTAASLRRVADTYESYAQREDSRAAEWSQERY